MAWTIEYYTDVRGRSPIDEFLSSLSARDEAKVAHVIGLLAEFGLRLRMPYARHVEGKLWELRIRSSGKAYRVLYFAYTGRRFVLLHGFLKKSRKTPRRELETAKRRLADYLARHEDGG